MAKKDNMRVLPPPADKSDDEAKLKDDMFQFAKTNYTQLECLIQAGFTREEALRIVLTIISEAIIRGYKP